jgi:hypothetical protein
LALAATICVPVALLLLKRPFDAKAAPYTLRQLESDIDGTFISDAGAQMSMTFSYPKYTLNQTRDFVPPAAGNTGKWDILPDGDASLQKADGWFQLSMTTPNRPTESRFSRVHIHFGSDGEVSTIEFSDIFGAAFPDGQSAVFRRVPPDDVLAKTFYTVDKCLVCGSQRSASSIAKYSDRRGYGLCDDCGAAYKVYRAQLLKAKNGLPLSQEETDSTHAFADRFAMYFPRNGDDLRRTMALFFLSGDFASQQWNELTSIK